MSSEENWADFPSDFSGVVRLFPLPNLVLFPHVVQPLRIFEPRYRELMGEALQNDHLIAMSLLLPGWEKSYFSQPPVAPVLCIGRVITHTKETNGDYKLLLLGLRRARIDDELGDVDRPYRQARVSILEDQYPSETMSQRGELQRRLRDNFQQIIPDDDALRRQYSQLLSAQIPLGPLTDIIAFSMNFDVDFKQQLLSELNVDRRAERLLDALATAPKRYPFPPTFSEN